LGVVDRFLKSGLGFTIIFHLGKHHCPSTNIGSDVGVLSVSSAALSKLANFFHDLSQHFHARRLLLIRLLGSFAVFAEVSFFFIPFIRAQNESRRGPPSGCGAFSPGLPGLAAL
jgi:hypothetical protein